MQETDAKLNLLTRFSECFVDGRNPALIEHSAEQMVRQRVYALALGYEDLNDHDQPRLDPLLGALAGKAEPGRDRFYHGYYGHYCYLPLYIVRGQHVLCARLRPASIGPAGGSAKEVAHIVQQLRVVAKAEHIAGNSLNDGTRGHGGRMR